MFETYMAITTVITIVMAALAIIVIPPLLMVQYYIHKKILDPTYYNTEHFSAGEIVIFASGFIFYLSKTILYVRAIVLPKTMRIRFKEDILIFKNHPTAYLLACFTMLIIAYFAVALINIIIALILWEYNK